MASGQTIAELGRRVSNWGRWGADDERGTLNFVTPEVIRRGAACVRTGRVFSLGLSFGAEGPQIGQGGRVNPLHLMTATEGRLGSDPDGPRYADDVVVMPLQCATQWDSLAHVFYDGKLYNGFPASTITAAGAARNSIDRLGRGVVSRGVLLDLARYLVPDRQTVRDAAPEVARRDFDLRHVDQVHASTCLRDRGVDGGQVELHTRPSGDGERSWAVTASSTTPASRSTRRRPDASWYGSRTSTARDVPGSRRTAAMSRARRPVSVLWTSMSGSKVSRRPSMRVPK